MKSIRFALISLKYAWWQPLDYNQLAFRDNKRAGIRYGFSPRLLAMLFGQAAIPKSCQYRRLAERQFTI
ncbi:hypothetical protein [Paenibacillus whitsoniae]|uniref:Uncharacterized protein n=1 Tax=Paenibacillus whitsoniae TaxID=2496558 RepID=A0A3S0ANU3_9BACL|nr:hypothetical protein [Paenibacillus whitsoniae]RTE08721.1 hypothetical protein EJQ19_15745 [Paenibacillus whitsoniae]